MPAATSLTAMESLLCAALRGTSGVWRQLGDPVDQASFLEAAARHRVRPLLAWRLRNTRGVAGVAGRAAELLCMRRSARRRRSKSRDAADLTMLLGALGAAGIPVLLLKGAAFGYTLYPEPWLRPRHGYGPAHFSQRRRRGSTGPRARRLPAGPGGAWPARRASEELHPARSRGPAQRLRSPLETGQSGGGRRSPVIPGVARRIAGRVDR